MSGSFSLISDAESVEALAVPSIEAVRGTFAAMDRTVEMVAADCRTVAETLSGLNEALGTISQSGGGAQQWGGMGLIGLPIMGAIKASTSGNRPGRRWRPGPSWWPTRPLRSRRTWPG